MNAQIFRARNPGLALLLLLGACSGGDVNVDIDGPVIPNIPPASTSEAITTHGVITGLGSITVNDVTYATNGAMVTVNGQAGSFADLKLGQVVTLTGRINWAGQSGTASRIELDANLVGPVEGIDAANGQLIVMGQTVMRDEDTVFGNGIDPDTFAGLAVGSVVEISGYADAAGSIRATRLDPAAANAEQQLIGKVSSLDLANRVFTINRLTVDYGNAALIDVPGGAPSAGMMVKVFGALSGGLFTVERLVAAPDMPGITGQRVHLGGLITRFASSSDFDVNGHRVFTNAGTAYANGDAGDLALNAEIVVDGDFASGDRIQVDQVTFGRLLGRTTTQTFGFRDFTAISVPTVFNVTVTQGSDFSVAVTVDEEAQNRINVTQTGATLNIALLTGNGNISTLDAYVTMPVLERIDLTGVVNATLNDFDQAQMTINVGGVSRLQGNALRIGDLTANVSGVSQLDLGGIRPITEASINVGGVSQATLNMDVGATMTGSVGTGQGTGVSTLFYYGTNVAVNVSTDALSSVIRLGETRP
ncbi:MAG: DUF5666 domain-containing protein [Gammaproteobacteria bacterium]|nr:DUF5666 domain-containing protein [Gammaproteobacteria bacterium]